MGGGQLLFINVALVPHQYMVVFLIKNHLSVVQLSASSRFYDNEHHLCLLAWALLQQAKANVSRLTISSLKIQVDKLVLPIIFDTECVFFLVVF